MPYLNKERELKKKNASLLSVRCGESNDGKIVALSHFKNDLKLFSRRKMVFERLKKNGNY
jgi:hypothetical protein